MKDLFVLTADADMQAVFRAILVRHEVLGIRQIDFTVDRHTNRDSGVFRTGPEFLRAIPKQEYARFLIAFDHDGSGCSKSVSDCAEIVQARLNSCSFTDRSSVVIIEPELEEWLWHDAAPDPKERLQREFLKSHMRPPRVRDYEQIAAQANLTAWESSVSFRNLKATLQDWFPRE